MKKILFIILSSVFLTTGCITNKIEDKHQKKSLLEEQEIIPIKERISYKVATFTEAESKAIDKETKNISNLDCANKDMEQCAFLAIVEYYSLLKACPIAIYNQSPNYSKQKLWAMEMELNKSLAYWDVYQLKNEKFKRAFDSNDPFVKTSIEKTTVILNNRHILQISMDCAPLNDMHYNQTSLNYSTVNHFAKTKLPDDWIKNFK